MLCPAGHAVNDSTMRIDRPRSSDAQTSQFPAQRVTGPPWLWMAAYVAMAFLLSRHALTPLVPGTTFSLTSLPVALLAFALMIRPWREAPFYALVHAAAGTLFHEGITYPAFNAGRIALEIVEAVVLVAMLQRFFYARLGHPLYVAIYTVAVLAVTAIGGFLLVGMAFLLLGLGLDSPPVLIDYPGLAWRYWWLGRGCSYLTLAGPLAVLVVVRGALARVLRDRTERRTFLWLSAALLAVSLIAYPVVDLSWMGLPPDVRQALRLVPMPFAVVLAARFRAKGGASATLVLTLVVILSVTGPNAAPNWAGMAPTATPTQALLLMTATACMVTGAMARQLLKANAEAIEAREVKTRFVAMLNHELRTPLNAILGFSELMRQQKIEDIGSAMGPIDNIHASGQRLLAMIEGLLSQADHGASAFDLHKHPLPLGATVAAVLEELQSELHAFRFPLRVEIPDELRIEADERALRQILMVLLAYPLRFVTPWTEVSVSARQSGTDTLLEVDSRGLVGAVDDERDRLELQLAKALALAHGARLSIDHSSRDERLARLTFFATKAAG